MAPMLFLIGARAAGKTTCGRALSKSMGLEFFDTDAILRERAGRSVAQIVECEGWEGFRQRESDVLRSLASGAQGGVVATGGGMVLAPDNRALLRRSGLVVFLDAPAEVLAARLEAAPKAAQRPPLGVGNAGVLEEVRAVLAARRELYLATAHRVVNAARPLPEVLADLQSLCSG